MNQQFNYGFQPNPYYVHGKRARGYGLSNLVGDVVLTIATGGLWLLWWIFREVSR